MKKIYNHNPTRSSQEFVQRRKRAIVQISSSLLCGILLFLVLGIFSLPILLLITIYVKNKYTLYREYAINQGVIETEPPHDLRPAEIGFMYDHSHGIDLIVSIMIDLVVRGYFNITIIEPKKDANEGMYVLSRTQKHIENLRSYEKYMLDFLFTQDTTVKWKDVYRNQDTALMLSNISFMIQEELQRRDYYHFFQNIDDHAYEKELRNVQKKMVRGIWEGVWNFGKGLSGYATNKRYEILPYIIGYRNYLVTAEMERTQFHVDPGKLISYLDETTPYIIAFGLNKMWQDELWGMTWEPAEDEK